MLLLLLLLLLFFSGSLPTALATCCNVLLWAVKGDRDHRVRIGVRKLEGGRERARAREGEGEEGKQRVGERGKRGGGGVVGWKSASRGREREGGGGRG